MNLVTFFIFLIVLLPKLTLLTIPQSAVGIRFDDLGVVLISFYLAAVLLRQRRWQLLAGDRINQVWFLFIGWGVVTTGLGIMNHTVEDAGSGFLYLGRTVEFLVVYLASRYSRWSGREVRTFIGLLLLAAFGVLLYGFLQMAELVPYFSTLQSISFDGEITYTRVGVVMSTFAGHYDFGIFLVLMICLLIGIVRHRLVPKMKTFSSAPRSWIQLSFATTGFLLALLGLYTSHSRSAYIALVVVLFVLGLATSRVLTILAVSLGVLLNYLFLRGKISILPTQVRWGSVDLLVDQSTMDRLAKWNLLFSNLTFWTLLVGEGFSSQGLAMDGYYVRLLGEAGVIGCLLFGMLLYLVIHRALRLWRIGKYLPKALAEGLFLGIFALLAQAVFIDIFVSTKIMYFFWGLAGLVVALAERPDSVQSELESGKI